MPGLGCPVSSVFHVASPMQLWNAVEARAAFRCDPFDCLLLIAHSKDKRQNNDQLDRLASSTGWERRIAYSVAPLRDGAIDYLRSIRAIKTTATRVAQLPVPVDNYFVGDYNADHIRHVSNVVRSERVVALDDGMATLQIAARRRRGIERWSTLHLKRHAKSSAFGLKLEEADRLTFFTAYDIRGGHRDRVVRNRFELLRSMMESHTDPGYGAAFIGQPLVEQGIVGRSIYMDGIRRFLAQESVESGRYFAHRREDDRNLEIVERETGWEVVRPDRPIELWLAERAPGPSVIGGFYSSALWNLGILFEGTARVVSMRVDPGALNKHREHIGHVYAVLLQNENITEGMVPA